MERSVVGRAPGALRVALLTFHRMIVQPSPGSPFGGLNKKRTYVRGNTLNTGIDVPGCTEIHLPSLLIQFPAERLRLLRE